jgi:hypothetical protein
MNKSTLRCGYCNQFSSGKVFKSGDTVKRLCIARQDKVDFNHETCKYFDPVQYFQCIRHGERITFAHCAIRRFNHAGLSKYSYCKRCRQFDQELSEIMSKYIVDGAKIKKYNPDKPLRKLARRDKSAKRSIKRRTPKKRVLKKRKEKPKRKLKRRS